MANERPAPPTPPPPPQRHTTELSISHSVEARARIAKIDVNERAHAVSGFGFRFKRLVLKSSVTFGIRGSEDLRVDPKDGTHLPSGGRNRTVSAIEKAGKSYLVTISREQDNAPDDIFEPEYLIPDGMVVFAVPERE